MNLKIQTNAKCFYELWKFENFYVTKLIIVMILIFISEVGSICWWVDTPGVDTYKFDTKTFKSNCFRNFLSTLKLRVFHDFQSGKLFVPTGWYITTEQKFDYFSIKFSNGLSSMNIYISLFAFEFFFLYNWFTQRRY